MSHNLPKYCHQLGTSYSNTWTYRRHLTLKLHLTDSLPGLNLRSFLMCVAGPLGTNNPVPTSVTGMSQKGCKDNVALMKFSGTWCPVSPCSYHPPPPLAWLAAPFTEWASSIGLSYSILSSWQIKNNVCCFLGQILLMLVPWTPFWS